MEYAQLYLLLCCIASTISLRSGLHWDTAFKTTALHGAAWHGAVSDVLHLVRLHVA